MQNLDESNRETKFWSEQANRLKFSAISEAINSIDASITETVYLIENHYVTDDGGLIVAPF